MKCPKCNEGELRPNGKGLVTCTKCDYKISNFLLQSIQTRRMEEDIVYDEYDKMPQEVIGLLDLKKKIKTAKERCQSKYSYTIKDLCEVCEWTVVCKEVE